MDNYDVTPSYFKNCEYFEQYLGRTSYYTGLQNALERCIHMAEPQKVLDLGCALGTTTFLMAEKFPKTEFNGLDMRKDVVSKTNREQEARDSKWHGNASFIQADMMDFVTKPELAEYGLIYMLYSFHHIPDPKESKMKFLRDAYTNMAPGAYLWIGETFLPDDGTSIESFWDMRSHEGYASTFWSCLDRGASIKTARDAANVSKKEEMEAGYLVEWRNTEYLVLRHWAAEQIEEAGFKLVIDEPVNALGDGVLFARKEG